MKVVRTQGRARDQHSRKSIPSRRDALDNNFIFAADGGKREQNDLG